MIAVKNSCGQTVARSIIKLLWEDAKGEPVLLKERVYANNEQLIDVVDQVVQKEAARLGVELIVDVATPGRRFQSCANRSGFEYEDAHELSIDEVK